MTSEEVTRMLAGGRIKRVKLNSAGVTAGGQLAQHVQIYLSNGTVLGFIAQELPHGDGYGVCMTIARTGRGTYFTHMPITEQKHTKETK